METRKAPLSLPGRHKKAVRIGLIAAAVAAAAYGMVYLDVLARAREAFGQAETFARWQRDPEEKERSSNPGTSPSRSTCWIWSPEKEPAS